MCTNAHRRGEMPLQMPLYVCKCPYARPNAPRSRAGNTNAPIHARKCPYLSGGENNPLVFDIPVRVSVLEPPIIPQNAPIRRGKCPAMCAGKIKCPALYAPVCPYIRASGPIPPEPPDRLNRSGPPDLSGPIPDRRVF